ncbi:quinone oxidoreductase family protein [Streptomyces lavenduligriseus]|uniref:Quinone oxidoreductase n=1 Tax=Streptomyces lavenduligriseus TaxID=67315 RepID=A0ABT0NNC5_9ACTN|nr:quinone oxidoreductase [Streptomyces lavenduligriseus]MCL3992362.1 quinone oxidoreductase [Streptomyces lavenduligriseus]
MHAIVVTEPGGPDALRYRRMPDPVAGPGEVLVRTRAIGVNYRDVYVRRGEYPAELPVPGLEGAGEVVAVGEGAEVAVGDRVAWAYGKASYAELVAVPADQCVPVPDGIDWQVAGGALLQGMTAHYLLESVYRPAPEEPVLIHAGAGGMGQLLVQWAAARGAKVITTVSTDEKEKLAREAGAWHVLRYGDDLAGQVRELTDGEGVHAVYDGVGAATFEASLASLRPRGTLALFGSASGRVPPFDLQRLAELGSLLVTRPVLPHFVRTRAEVLWRANEVFGALSDNVLRVRFGGTYALSEAEQAHRAIESRTTTGSLVLLPD